MKRVVGGSLIGVAFMLGACGKERVEAEADVGLADSSGDDRVELLDAQPEIPADQDAGDVRSDTLGVPSYGDAADASEALSDADAGDTPHDDHEIVYSSNGHLWKVRPDGTDPIDLMKSAPVGLLAMLPAWSRDRAKIALIHNTGSDPFQLAIINPDGTGMLDIASIGGNASKPSWTPTNGIVFSREDGTSSHLFIVDVAGKGETQLTSGDWEDVFPTVAPDGKHVAFASTRGVGSLHIYVMSIDGTGVLPLTPFDQNDSQPSWSPDGRRIAFQRSYPYPDYRIMTIGADGKGELELTASRTLDFGAAWSPDASRLVFARETSVGYSLFTMDADGTGVGRITTTASQDADW